MPNFRPVLFVVGMLLVALAIAMVIPGLASHIEEHGLRYPFLAAGAATLFVGGAAVILGWERRTGLNVREAFLITTSAWVAVALAGALPLYMGGEISFTDAVFESMSGLTTTGSSVLPDLDRLPTGILLWRSTLQWIGGVGIIAMAILILPFLRVGGMQLFRAESSDRSEKIIARPLEFSAYLLGIYAALTVACGLAYWLAGMSAFDAVNHAMCTIATAGFSTHNDSFGFFEGHAVKWVGTVFMALGALPFVLYIKTVKGDRTALLRDQQVRGFVVFLVVAILVMTATIWDGTRPFDEALTQAAFNVTSVVTTTGFASADYNLWGAFPVALVLILTFVGGCTGSTAGAIKMFRFQIMWMVAHEQVRKLVLPNLFVSRTYNRQPVSGDVVRSVIAFVFAYFGAVGLLTLGLAAYGLDLLTAFSGAATAIGNVGPGLGPTIGPVGSFASLPDGAKWLLTAGMLLGRLEFFTVLVLFTRTFWRA